MENIHSHCILEKQNSVANSRGYLNRKFFIYFLFLIKTPETWPNLYFHHLVRNVKVKHVVVSPLFHCVSISNRLQFLLKRLLIRQQSSCLCCSCLCSPAIQTLDTVTVMTIQLQSGLSHWAQSRWTLERLVYYLNHITQRCEIQAVFFMADNY